MLMQGVSTAHADSLIHTVFEMLEKLVPVILKGPSGSGKTHALRALSVALAERAIPHQYVDAAKEGAAAKLERIPPGAVLLFDDCADAPVDVLQAAANRLATDTRFVGAVTESVLGPGGGSAREFYAEMPVLHDRLGDTQTIRIPPHSPEEIARLVHRHSPEPVDAATVAAIQQLAWGRPGWALDLLRLQRRGSFTHTPRPRVTQLHTEDMQLVSLREALGIATSRLDADGIAAAVVLAEIGPRSWNGVADIVGAEEAWRLARAGFLLKVPGTAELYGVPELYAAAAQRLSDAEKLVNVRRSAAEMLLSQELFGIPLPDREAIFCGRVLSNRDRDPAADPILAAQHSQFIKRVIGDLVSFGEGAQARDMLLRLGQQGPGLSMLERARLATVLSNAHAGLQAFITASSPRANFDLEPADLDVRFAGMLLRGRLAAEVGIPLEDEPGIDPDNQEWCDAGLVVRRWNDVEPLGADSGALMRIAETHRMPLVALLAEMLLALEASFFGLRYRAFADSRIEQRIAQLAVQVTDRSRDALEAAAVAHGITQAFTTKASPGDDQPYALATRLPGASRHRIWATHLQAMRTAVMCGDAGRTAQEWQAFAGSTPRFLPWRLHRIISLVDQPSQSATPMMNGPMGPLVEYYLGRIDGSTGTRLGDAYRDFVRYSGHQGDDALLEESPTLPLIRKHLEALASENPLALSRVGEELAAHGIWAPALSAYREARRIYLRRRATGSVTSADERIQALEAEIAAKVSWFDPAASREAHREHLTPRETAAAKLAATGLSNREIAERMQCSVRTVESHIAQARAKLGLASREELKARFA